VDIYVSTRKGHIVQLASPRAVFVENDLLDLGSHLRPCTGNVDIVLVFVNTSRAGYTSFELLSFNDKTYIKIEASKY
jgi:hypothetical protein